MAKKRNKFALGTVFGAVTGLVAGLLLAPKSGKETRQDIKRAAGNIIEDSKKVQQELARVIKAADERLRRAGRRAGSKQKELVKQTKAANRKLTAIIKSVTQGQASDRDLSQATNRAKESLAALKKYLKK